MPDVTRLVLLVHVLAAFGWVAGYMATNMLTELARRTDDPSLRRQALHFSGLFDRTLNAPGGVLAGITGVAALFVFGHSLTTVWVLASIVIYLLIGFVGGFFWRRVGQGIDRATTAGDEARALAILRSSRNVAVSRGENVLVLVLIALMVLRPGS